MARQGRWITSLGLVAATVIIRGGALRAQTAATVNVTVDATAPGAPLSRIWSNFGYDEVNYSTVADGRALLKTLATANTAPVYVRTHFLLNTGNGVASLKWGSTNAYTVNAAGAAVYDWTLLDGIMDAITTSGALPLAEIAFMPQALSVHPTPYQNTSVRALDGGCFYPPTDYGKWNALVRAWATHMKDRYPNVEQSWLWELWNEPDIGYWHGTFDEYAKLYDYTEDAVHAVLPNARVGGPAVAVPLNFLTLFLQHCASGVNALTGQRGTRLDLVSFHAKGGVAVTGGHVQMNLGNQLRLHRNGFDAVAAIPTLRQKPIYITEADPDGCAACPASEIPADAYRNSPAYGAYEVAMMKRTLDLEERLGVNVGGLITWAFTFPSSPYFAGYRALTSNGITMPVLGAFKLLGSLGGARLPVTSSGALSLDAILAAGVAGAQADIDAMATLNGSQVQVLVWNYHDALVAVPASRVHLSVAVPTSFGDRVSVSNLRVDETHGDAYSVWVAQGSPAAPSATQLAAMRQAMEPVALVPPQSLAVTSGAVAVDFDLPRFGISLLTLTPVSTPADASTSDANAAGDGGRGDGAGPPGDARGDGTSGSGDGPPADLAPGDTTPRDAEGGGSAPDASSVADRPGATDTASADLGVSQPDTAPATNGDGAAAGDARPVSSPSTGAGGCSCDAAAVPASANAWYSGFLGLLAAAASMKSRRRKRQDADPCGEPHT